jgi:archaellum component FlaC
MNEEKTFKSGEVISMLEQMNDGIKVIGEQYEGLNSGMNGIKKEIGGIKNELSTINNRLDGIDGKL